MSWVKVCIRNGQYILPGDYGCASEETTDLVLLKLMAGKGEELHRRTEKNLVKGWAMGFWVVREETESTNEWGKVSP